MKLIVRMRSEHGDAVNPDAQTAPGKKLSESTHRLLGATGPPVAPIQVHEIDSEVVVASRAESARGLVVRVTSPSPRNPIHRALRALHAIGIQIAHARVRLEYGRMVQILSLRELDDRPPVANRVPHVLQTLREACSLPSDPENAPPFPGPASTATRELPLPATASQR